jgi:Ribbon-helix-helix domain
MVSTSNVDCGQALVGVISTDGGRLLKLHIYRTLQAATCKQASVSMISNSKGIQVQITSYFEPEAVRRLKALSQATRVPQSVYLREALDDLLRKYATTLKKAK